MLEVLVARWWPTEPNMPDLLSPRCPGRIINLATASAVAASQQFVEWARLDAPATDRQT
jgi:hypothetical protein